MNPAGGRDVLVVLREELARARAALEKASLVWKGEHTAPQLQQAAQKLFVAAEALDARIHAPFDAVLLDRAAAAFRSAAAQLSKQLDDRQVARRASTDIGRVMKRFVAHAREIGKLTAQRGADNVGAAMEALGTEEGWTGAPLDAVVQLVDTLEFLSREKLGEQARASQVSSLVDRAASTAMVTCMHALKDLAQRVRSEPNLIKDRFAMLGALKPAGASVVERLAGWLALDENGRAQLQGAIEQFEQKLLDRLTVPTPPPRRF
jgi:hypothetical protein